jgi:hypothetical protein
MTAMLMQERFQEAAAPFVEFGGHTVWAIHDLPLVPILRIHFQSANEERPQGIGLEAKGSPIEINGEQRGEFRLWTDSAPERVDVKVVDLARLRQLRVWNTWKYPNGATDAWTGNFGMVVEHDEGGLSFRCSDGLGEAGFTDLVFRVETVMS